MKKNLFNMILFPKIHCILLNLILNDKMLIWNILKSQMWFWNATIIGFWLKFFNVLFSKVFDILPWFEMEINFEIWSFSLGLKFWFVSTFNLFSICAHIKITKISKAVKWEHTLFVLTWDSTIDYIWWWEFTWGLQQLSPSIHFLSELAFKSFTEKIAWQM